MLPGAVYSWSIKMLHFHNTAILEKWGYINVCWVFPALVHHTSYLKCCKASGERDDFWWVLSARRAGRGRTMFKTNTQRLPLLWIGVMGWNLPSLFRDFQIDALLLFFSSTIIMFFKPKPKIPLTLTELMLLLRYFSHLDCSHVSAFQ